LSQPEINTLFGERICIVTQLAIIFAEGRHNGVSTRRSRWCNWRKANYRCRHFDVACIIPLSLPVLTKFPVVCVNNSAAGQSLLLQSTLDEWSDIVTITSDLHRRCPLCYVWHFYYSSEIISLSSFFLLCTTQTTISCFLADIWHTVKQCVQLSCSRRFFCFPLLLCFFPVQTMPLICISMLTAHSFMALWSYNVSGKK